MENCDIQCWFTGNFPEFTEWKTGLFLEISIYIVDILHIWYFMLPDMWRQILYYLIYNILHDILYNMTYDKLTRYVFEFKNTKH